MKQLEIEKGRIINPVKKGWRVFHCANGKGYQARYNSCLFCSRCSDVFYDYTHGPYLFICEDGLDTEDGIRGMCLGWKNDE